MTFDRDETGLWVASIPDVQGCHTQGRTLAQARLRIREALAVSLDSLSDSEADRVARNAILHEEIRLPKKVREKLDLYRAKRLSAELADCEMKNTMAATAVALTDSFGLSLRDAGELLGLSHERVNQIIGRR